MTEYELKPTAICRQKSFYGKANVYDFGHYKALRSYRTFVCAVDEDGRFHKLWDGWSRTTAMHVDEFRAQNGLGWIGKAGWEALECEPAPPELYGGRL